jgi:hypothetical protein
LEADASELLTVLSELDRLIQALPELFDGLVNISELSPELARIDDASTFRAGRIRFSIKPSDRLLKLVAALRTCERELLIAKDLTHV